MATSNQSKAKLDALIDEYTKKLARLDEKLGGAEKLRRDGVQTKRPRNPWLDEYVEIKLFKDGKDYKNSVFVAVNGENCLIPRGQWFRVKRKFALVLDQSEIQDQRTAELIERESGAFAAAAAGRI
ncbi:MAG: hypothetical protein IJP23_03870 [Oscillospiraceae bacterium]|nr:hypothetical protein [Oscillospiraceae bacterium]